MSGTARRLRSNALRLVMASAIALEVGACGGGGGGGGGLASTPAPPSSAPTPTPTPSVASISAPAAASSGTGAMPVVAVEGGPSFKNGPTQATTFPLLQTTLVVDQGSIKPDAAVNAVGGTATAQAEAFEIDVNGFEGKPDMSGHADLDWTRVGYWSTGGVWDYWEDTVRHRGVFVTGYETATTAVPSSGTATYTGRAEGYVYLPVTQGSGSLLCNCAEVSIFGDASFTANFGARTLSGSLSNMWAGGDPWNNVAFSSTIAGNAFGGTTLVTSAPGGRYSLSDSASGTIQGKFFGPSAQEAGAVWTLFDGTKAVIGTLSGKRPGQ